MQGNDDGIESVALELELTHKEHRLSVHSISP